MVIDKIKELAEINGFNVSDKANRIIAAKERMFGEDWQRCPCDGNNDERFCCSQLCQSDVKTQGRCHCGLFVRKD